MIFFFFFYRDEYEELSRDREELKTINQDLQNSIIQTQNANNLLKRELIELKENSIDRGTIQHEIDTLQEEKTKIESVFNTRLNELENSLNERENIIKELNAKNKDLESNIANSEPTDETKDSWEARLSQRYTDLNSLETELDSITSLRENLESKNNEIELLNKKIEDLSINDTIDQYTTTDPEFMNRYEATLRENEALTSQVKTIEEEHERLGEAFKEARGELSRYFNIQENYQNESHEKELIISRLNDEVTELRQQGECGSDELKEKDNLILELNQENETLKAEKMKLIELNDELNLMKDSLDESRILLDERTQQFEQLQREYDQKENSFAVITGECSALNLSMEESKNEAEQLAKSFELVQAEKLSIEQVLKGVQDENARLSEVSRGWETKCGQLKSKLEEKEQLVDSLKDSLVSNDDDATSKSHILEELQNLKGANEQSENELQSALNKLDELEAVLTKKDGEVKEKSEKAAKLRNVALKAKKELENLRNRGLEDKKIHEEKMLTMTDEMNIVKNELVQKNNECSKHEEEFEVNNFFFFLFFVFLLTFSFNIIVDV